MLGRGCPPRTSGTAWTRGSDGRGSRGPSGDAGISSTSFPLSSQSPPMVVRDTVVVGSTINDRVLTKESPPGLGPCLRHPDGPPPVGLPHRPAECGRVRRGHLARRVLALLGQHQHLVADERRRGAGLRLSAGRHRDQRLLRGAAARRQPVRREPGGGRRRDGQRQWHFQMVHHGLWDYDNPAAPNLLDLRVERDGPASPGPWRRSPSKDSSMRSTG